MSSSKFICDYYGWIIWRDKNGSSHSYLGKNYDVIMTSSCYLGYLHNTETDGNITAIEESIADKENIVENVERTAHDSKRLDEDLITAVKERPALYDYRIPVKERGRKQKDYLWQEVSKYLKAEKRWIYLKDCYRKARNIFKKKQSIVQKSGAAGLPKNYEVKPSFRHYNVMTFLNDTLKYRQTVTSLQKSIVEDQVSILNNSIPSTSRNNDDQISMDNSNSTSLSHVSLSPKSKNGFVSPLAKGLRRLSYKSKLEIEFLSRLLYEVEEQGKRSNRCNKKM
ncbi:hypothetical protein P5V15_001305 [Pogonomyrmex californicus]